MTYVKLTSSTIFDVLLEVFLVLTVYSAYVASTELMTLPNAYVFAISVCAESVFRWNPI
jgi:hypothetical protein